MLRKSQQVSLRFYLALHMLCLSLVMWFTGPPAAEASGGWRDVTGQFEVRYGNPRRDRRTGEVVAVVTVENKGAPISGNLRLQAHSMTPPLMAAPGFPAHPEGGFIVALPDTLDRGETAQAAIVFKDAARLQFSFETTIELLDTLPPKVTRHWPRAEAVDVATNTLLLIQLNERIDPDSITGTVVTVTASESSSIVDGQVAVVGDGSLLRFVPTEPFLVNSTFNVSVTGARDLVGNTLEPKAFSFSTGTRTDTSGPAVVQWSPPRDSENVPVNAGIKLRFSEPLFIADLENLIALSFRSPGFQGGIPGNVTVSDDWQTVVFLPDQSLPVGSQVSISVSRDLKDLAGNAMRFSLWERFDTDFSPDNEPPRIEATSVVDGQTEVPLNARLNLRFNEPVSLLNEAVVSLTQDGITVPSTVTLNRLGTIITVEPIGRLEPLTSTLLSATGISDLGGNALSQGTEVTFYPGSSEQPRFNSVTDFSPSRDQKIPPDAVFEMRTDSPIDPSTLTLESFGIYNESLERNVPGSHRLSENNRRVAFVPDSPLSDSYEYTINRGRFEYLEDLAGNRFTSLPFFSFLPPFLPEVTLIDVLGQNIPSGATDVPLNAVFTLAMNKQVNAVCASNPNSRLESETHQIGLDVEVLENNIVRIEGAELLLPSQSYALVLEGLCDLAGKELPEFRVDFTTSANAMTDRSNPILVSISPMDRVEEVPLDSSIVAVFSEDIDPILAQQVTVSAFSSFGSTNSLPGTISVSGNTLTFTPEEPLPGGSQLRINLSTVNDFAGNRVFGNYPTFHTTAAQDSVAPSVVSVSPSNGSDDVAPQSTITINFSEPVNTRSLDRNNIFLWSEGVVYAPSVHHSADNRTATLIANLRDGQRYAIVVLPEIFDLSGNKLESLFVSVFDTANTDALQQRPRITGQFPAPGTNTPSPASGSSINFQQPIVLFSSREIDASTLSGNVNVAVEGYPVEGETVLIAGNKAIQFTPKEPLPAGRVIQTFVEEGLRDMEGRSFFPYETSFTTTAGGPVEGDQPYVVQFPTAGRGQLPTNASIKVRYSEPLDPDTVNSQTVTLLDEFNNERSISVELQRNGRVVSVTPDNELSPDRPYRLTLSSGIRDEGGEYQRFQANYFFSTTQQRDVRGPRMLGISPQPGTSDFPINASFHARFDEPISRADFPYERFSSIIFSSDGKSFDYALPGLLPVDSTLEEELPIVYDLADNASESFTTRFTTGNTIDTTAPTIIADNLPEFRERIPVNAVLRFDFNEPLAPVSITGDRITLRESGGALVQIELAQSNDGRSLFISANTALKVGQRYSLRLDGIKDFAGNETFGRSFSFETAFAADSTPPQVRTFSFFDGETGLPRNALPRVSFTEPVIAASLESGHSFRLYDQAGGRVGARVTVASDGASATLQPLELLQPNSQYQLELADVSDRSGNLMEQPIAINFKTRDVIDTVRPKISWYSPSRARFELFSEHTAPPNTIAELRLSEPLDPASFTPETISLRDWSTLTTVKGTAVLGEDGTRVTFTPSEALQVGRRYVLRDSSTQGWYDKAGNRIFWSGDTFTVQGDADLTAPKLTGISLQDGATGVPVNAMFSLRYDERLNMVCASGALSLRSDSGSFPVELSLYDDLTLRVRPVTNLPPLEELTLRIEGVCDFAGQEAADQSFSFVTASDSTPDEERPEVLSISPDNRAFDVSPDEPIVIIFSENVDFASTNQITVTADNAPVTGTFVVEGRRVTFTPSIPLAGFADVEVRIGEVTDLAGNELRYSIRSEFATTGERDTTPPEVLSITPPPGAENIHPNTLFVITFSEPLDRRSLQGSNLFIWSGEVITNRTVMLSSDRQTVTVRSFLPEGEFAALVGLPSISDIAGNTLESLIISPVTIAETVLDRNHPRVLQQYPSAGSVVDSVDRILLVLNESVDGTTLDGNFFVAQDGILLSGETSLTAENSVIEFIPDEPVTSASLVSVFLEDGVTDIEGNELFAHQSSFRVAPGGALPGEQPRLARTNPGAFSNSAPINTRIMAAFTEPLDPTTVTTNTVSLSVVGGSSPDYSVSVSGNGRIIEILPNSNLSPDTSYRVSFLPTIKDVNDEPLRFMEQFTFRTRTSDAVDNVSPQIMTVSPPANATGLGINTRFNLAFSEPINEVTFPYEDYGSVMFGADGLSVQYTPRQFVFDPDTNVMTSTPTLEDSAGNITPPRELQFSTSSGVDFEPPVLIASNPNDRDAEVPVNATFELVFDEPIDPVQLKATSSRLFKQNTNEQVTLELTLDDSGKKVIAAPQAPLDPASQYYWTTQGISDLSGNLASSYNPRFTTSSEADTKPPTVTGFSVPNGATNVPTNVRMRVALDEPIGTVRLSENPNFKLIENGVEEIPYTIDFSDDRSQAILLFDQLLQRDTSYTLEVEGVSDRSGNIMEESVLLSFSTGAEPDVFSGNFIATSPAGRATVPKNIVAEALTDEPVDPLSVNSQTVRLYNRTTRQYLPGAISLAENNTRIRFVPANDLVPGNLYELYFSYRDGVTDLAGTGFDEREIELRVEDVFDTTRGEIITASFPDEATDVPLNFKLNLLASESFSSVCYRSSANAPIVSVNNGSTPIEVSIFGRLVEIDFLDSPQPNTRYTVRVSGLCDIAGNEFTNFESSFTTGTDNDVFPFRPFLFASIPEQLEENVSRTDVVRVTFSEPIDETSLTDVELSSRQGFVPFETVYLGNTLTLRPLEPMPPNESMTLVIDDYRDYTGFRGSRITIQFTTGSE